MNVFGQKTLIANWFEDRVLQEDKIKDYLEKRERGELVSQKNELVADFLMNKATLASNPDGFIKFGDAVMIVNPHHEDQLALTYAGDQCGAFPSDGPQLRNSFIVFSTDGSKAGDRLRYGQPFAIATHSDIGDRPNFMESDYGGLLNTKKSRTQPIGFTEVACYGATWKIQCFDPLLRMETEGMPVPKNSPIIITHNKTNNNLSYLPAIKVTTPMGQGLEITARTELDSHNAEQQTNHWNIVCN